MIVCLNNEDKLRLEHGLIIRLERELEASDTLEESFENKDEVNEDDNEERTVTLLNVLHVAD